MPSVKICEWQAAAAAECQQRAWEKQTQEAGQ
jgi:hypothetical protein